MTPSLDTRGLPCHTDTLRQLAAFQMAHGAFGTAESLLHIATWLEPHEVRNWRLRAYALSALDRPSEALKLLLRARRDHGASSGLKDMLNVGLACARRGNVKSARATFEGKPEA